MFANSLKALIVTLAVVVSFSLGTEGRGTASARRVAGRPGLCVPAATTRCQFREAYGRLPMQFEANAGQADPRVKFLARGGGYTLFLTATGATLLLPQSAREPVPVHGMPSRSVARRSSEVHRRRPSASQRTVSLQMRLLGATPNPSVAGADELPGKVNYFIGSDPHRWHTNIPTYAKVCCRNVYPGVDVVYYGNQGQLEYDFVVAPGADPRRIRLGFEGAEKLSVAANGALVVGAGRQDVRFRRPRVYQEMHGVQNDVQCGWVVGGAEEAHFSVAGYNKRRPLVVDPVLEFSTYLGGSSDDSTKGITVDSTGCVYLVGLTHSTDFPITPGALQTRFSGGNYDAVVAKLNASGSAILYSTYLGGSDDEYGNGIAVDAGGCAYVAGLTKSPDYPTTPGAFQTEFGGFWDAYVAKLSIDGTRLLYSSCLGGSQWDECLSIPVDWAGCAYVTGDTSSADYPTTPGALQTDSGGHPKALITKVNPTGSALLYSTFLGGSVCENGFSIGVDSTGCAYVAGNSQSADFPTTPGAIQPSFGGGRGLSDAFVSKLNPSGSALLYSTYLGGSGWEWGYGIAVDRAGCAYVTGATWSTDFPTTAGAFQTHSGGGRFDAFVAKVSASGGALLYSSYLGGSGSDEGYRIAVDGAGCAYVAGQTDSDGFPTTPGASQTSFGGGSDDAFLVKLSQTGALLYSTFIGGTDRDTCNSNGLVVDDLGSAYVSVHALSSNLPTTAGVLQTHSRGGWDSFIAKFVPSSARLWFCRQPVTTVAGAALSPVQVMVYDETGGPILTPVAVTLSLVAGSGAPGASLRGTITGVTSSGVATFSGLTINTAGTGFALTARTSGCAAAASARFSVAPAPPYRAAFLTQPSETGANASIAPAVQVVVQDRYANVCTGMACPISLSLAAGPAGAALVGSLTRAAVSGIATFPGLCLRKAGSGYVLQAAVSGLPAVRSAAFTITPAAAARLVFTGQPANTSGGVAITPPVKVTVQDAYGNATSGPARTISVALGYNAVGGTLSGALAAATAGGTATFGSLRIDRAGRYTLTAIAPGLPVATSLPFSVVVGPAYRLVFAVGPSGARAGTKIAPAIQVAARDRGGNAVISTPGSVGVYLSTNPTGAVLTGTRSAAFNRGIARLADLAVSKPGSGYVLRATSVGVLGVYSTGFKVE